MRKKKRVFGLWVTVLGLLLALGGCGGGGSTPPSGFQVVWTRQFGTADGDSAYALILDQEGHVYVGGSIGNSNQTPGRAFLSRYTPQGDGLWTRNLDTPEYDGIFSLDARENRVYAGGYVGGALPGESWNGGLDAFVQAYGTDGTLLWTRQFGTGGNELARGLAVDPQGNLYLVGYTTGTLPGQTSAGDQDAFLRKYDPQGNELWTRQFGTAGSDFAVAVAVDPQGYVYVVGRVGGALPGQGHAGGLDVFVRKYDGQGNLLWTRQFGTAGDDFGVAAKVDSSGALYVSGRVAGTLPGQTSSGEADAFIRKYDPQGNELWTRQFGSEGIDNAWNITTDAGGYVYAVGYVGGALPGQTSAGSEDAYLRIYSPGGDLVWTYQFGTPGNDGAYTVAVLGRNVYVAGYAQGALPSQAGLGSYDAFLIRFSP